MANNDYKHMLESFRTIDLKTLLGTFGQSIVGKKSELKYRAIELLRSRSAGFNQADYVSKIHEIYCCFGTFMPKNDAIMNHNLLQTQQRQMMGQIQAPQQGIYQPAPQYNQLPMHMTRGGLSQVVPQTERNIYSNSIGI
ncbi:unnamed protein product [Macrosiphum euphorbiae]|uniref:SAP domain-containing protein n=1 Tax=Macrosiphum euphorbiae TaxID=13131 RepID=A0AAV0XX54_9HEMI|nr:unnamed protein product [Macrosiphum euphorbiae]